MANKRHGLRERKARKRRKRGRLASSATGMVTLKLGRKKFGEYFRKTGLPF